MAASCLSTPLVPLRGPIPSPSPGSLAGRSRCSRRGRRRPGAGRTQVGRQASAWPLAWLVAALLVAAALLAPEQPSAQAAICERHNGMAACRVW